MFLLEREITPTINRRLSLKSMIFLYIGENALETLFIRTDSIDPKRRISSYHIMNRRSALVVLIFYIGLQAIGQPVKGIQPIRTSEIPIDQYTAAEGLSQGYTSSVAIDHLGYLWITTKEGLNRFDGRTFKKFTHSAKDTASLAENYVTSLLAKDNKIWVGTISGKLDCLDVTTEKFIHINLKGSGPDIFGDQNIPSITSAGKNKVIADMGNKYKIIEYEQQLNGLVNISVSNLEDKYPALKYFDPEMSTPKNFLMLPNGKLCVQTGDSIFEYSTRARKLLYAYGRNEKDAAVRLILWKNPNNNEIFLAVNDRLLRYNQTKQKFVQCVQLPAPYKFSNYIFTDKEGKMWTPTKDRSFLRINIEKSEFDIIKMVAPGAAGWSKMENIVFSSHSLDAAGNIWFGSNGWGVIKLSPFALKFKKYTQTYNSKFSEGWQLRFSQNGLHAKYDAAVIDKYLELLDNSNLYKRGFRKSVLDEHFALDAEGNYWFSLVDEKLISAFVIKMNAVTGAYTIVMQKSLNNFRIFQPIYCDRKNKIWVCEATSSKTVKIHSIDAHTAQQQTFTLPKLQKSFSESRVVTDILDDADGNVWFASYMGLFKLSPITKTWTYIQEGKNSFGSNKLLALCEDHLQPNKYLWIGNEGNGLYRLDKGSTKITEYTTADGLPNNVIYSIQPDANNNLWLSTNNGLCLFNPATKTCTNFNKSHGLEGLEFNRYQFSRSTAGEIYLGGVGFSIHFNPQDFYRGTSSARMVINGLKVDNKEVNLDDEMGKRDPLINKAIDFSTNLVFEHNQSMVSLRFNLLDFTNPSSNRYRYKLAGLNNNWIDIGTNNEAVFTNLQPGEYTFFASGHNGDGNWSEPAKIILQILPAWWQTWWFKILSISMFVSLIYFFLKYRFKKKLEVEKMRNRIAQDLHDEIGSTLSSLGIYSAALSKTIYSKPDNAQYILDKISNSATHMMESMSDIVWSVNPLNDSLPILLTRMRSFAASVTESADVKLHFQSNMGESRKTLSMIDRKNLYLVFKEAVTNSLKHSGCKQLWVNLNEDGRQIKLDVIDDGKGFNSSLNVGDQKQSSGNGMRSMYARARESKAQFIVGAKEKGGTMIQLILEK